MATGSSVQPNLRGGALAEFEEIYRSNVGLVAAYFARRCREPQEVADLTSETIVRAAGSFHAFDPRRGSARAWLFGIAAHVWAGYCAQVANSRDASFGLRATGRWMPVRSMSWPPRSTRSRQAGSC